MARHHLLGKEGEALAAKWLEEKGYTLLHKNWRHAHSEVDIIASKEQVLHFIEVKTRRNQKFGLPEESVDEKKIRTLFIASEAYQHQYPEWKRVQYNVLSVTIHPNNTVDYFFIEDIYL